MHIGLGQTGATLGTGSGVNPAQIRGLRVELGCAQGQVGVWKLAGGNNRYPPRAQATITFLLFPRYMLVLYIHYFM